MSTTQNKILHLSLKQEWFDLIKSGVKLEEYREITPYWIKRLTDIEKYEHQLNTLIMTDKPVPMKHFTHVHFTLGYPKKDDLKRHMTFEIEKITINTGKPEWGAEENKQYFVIKIGKKVNL